MLAIAVLTLLGAGMAYMMIDDSSDGESPAVEPRPGTEETDVTTEPLPDIDDDDSGDASEGAGGDDDDDTPEDDQGDDTSAEAFFNVTADGTTTAITPATLEATSVYGESYQFTSVSIEGSDADELIEFSLDFAEYHSVNGGAGEDTIVATYQDASPALVWVRDQEVEDILNKDSTVINTRDDDEADVIRLDIDAEQSPFVDERDVTILPGDGDTIEIEIDDDVPGQVLVLTETNTDDSLDPTGTYVSTALHIYVLPAGTALPDDLDTELNANAWTTSPSEVDAYLGETYGAAKLSVTLLGSVFTQTQTDEGAPLAEPVIEDDSYAPPEISANRDILTGTFTSYGHT